MRINNENVNAWLYNGENHEDIKKFIGNYFLETTELNYISMKTPIGDMFCFPGEYVIKMQNGFVYPCHPDTFIKKYILKEVD